MLHISARQHYTRNVLIQFVVSLIVLALLMYWRKDFLAQVYIENQISSVGWTINGGIVLLFLAGLFRVLQLLFRYMGEEVSLNAFAHNLAIDSEPLEQVDNNSIVYDRFETLKMLHRRRASINHSALASTLLAREASYNSFPKFVHNTLILTGVFGTIVSLSIALLGASDMIDGAQTNSIGVVIHGMSTALSTTMTAIIAYLFFGYFYLKLTDAQTYLISRVEEVTATRLMPHFQLSDNAMLKEYADAITHTSNLIKRFDAVQLAYQNTTRQMTEAVASLQTSIIRDENQVSEMNQKLDRLVTVAEKTALKEDRSIERVIEILLKNARQKD